MGYYETGQIIKELRKKKKLTQDQLCLNICSKEYISKIENGHRFPSYQMAEKLFTRLGENMNHYFPCINVLDSEQFISDKKEIDSFLLKNKPQSALEHIQKLEYSSSLYSSDVPLQYLIGKKAFIYAKYFEDYEKCISYSLQSIKITKTDFTLSNIREYAIYNLEELWDIYNISYSLFMLSQADPLQAHKSHTAIELIEFVIQELEKKYINYENQQFIYPFVCIYLGTCYTTIGEENKSVQAYQKGFHFFQQYFPFQLRCLSKLNNQLST